ncbi:MAG: hypothetical protein WD749_07990 [Phycisphaerales bacterium]
MLQPARRALAAACAVAALAPRAGATPPQLLAADAAGAMLLRLDPSTGAHTVIGPLGANTVASLAFDSGQGILYATTTHSPTESNLLRINPATGASTLVGPLGATLMHALEYNALDQMLYGVSSGGGASLHRVNPLTGAATPVAALSLTGLYGLAFDPGAATMYAANIQTQNLYTLNLSSGALTLVGPFGAPGMPFPQVGVSMAFDPGLGLFAIDNTGIPGNANLLYRINTATGQATLVGQTAVANLLGLAFVPAPCYPNCDASTQGPVLNVSDFGCFLTRYAAGEAYANCDGSTEPPVLNVADFGCFLTKYAAGCP